MKVMANQSNWLGKVEVSKGGKPSGASACSVVSCTSPAAAGAVDAASCTTVPFCTASAGAADDDVACATRIMESAIGGHLACLCSGDPGAAVCLVGLRQRTAAAARSAARR